MFIGTFKKVFFERSESESQQLNIEYFKADLSFIPNEIITKSLRSYHNKTLINHCSCANRKTPDHTGKIDGYRQAVTDYYEFCNELRNFALLQYENNNVDLARKCYLFLIEISNDKAETKHLIRSYEILFANHLLHT
ncbi:hypothetical protein [Dethiobacter alkaliphilus]|uniref:hypothetical protein n=1 Tax=Dethiobacter alkaliphilus TaxID=427926 RepID=UPI002225D8AC|nr:hypothetical protein [Dethiobacter alkaliphilus]MCW3489508.1 hypothetical protein [Dethiobacter alkaliphilus]